MRVNLPLPYYQAAGEGTPGAAAAPAPGAASPDGAGAAGGAAGGTPPAAAAGEAAKPDAGKATPSLIGKEGEGEGTPKPPAEGEKKSDEKKDGEPAPAFDVKSLTLPEGLKADDPALGKFGEILADAKMDPKARGEALLSLYADLAKKGSAAATDLWNQTQNDWRKEVTNDPEIGGEKLQSTVSSVSKAIDSLGPELAKGFRQALDFTGAGNNPFIVKGMAKFAALLTEGGHVPGGPGKGGKTISQTFFPNSPEFNEPQKG